MESSDDGLLEFGTPVALTSLSMSAGVSLDEILTNTRKGIYATSRLTEHRTYIHIDSKRDSLKTPSIFTLTQSNHIRPARRSLGIFRKVDEIRDQYVYLA